jgi:hypothetical protein
MTAFAHSAEVLHKTDTQPEIQTVSALVRAGLAQFIEYPDIDHALHGFDAETSLPVEANISLSLEHEYKCMTCEDAIVVEERHIVISGVYSYRRRDETVFDHHHLHSDCFHEHELPFWDAITVSPMNKQRREVVLDRFRQVKMRHKLSHIAA